MIVLPRIFVLFTALMLAACNSTGLPDQSPPPSFKGMQAFNLAVSQVTITEEYHAPGKAPNIDHLFTTTPAQAVKIWVNDRLRAAGGDRTAEVIIKNASVIEAPLPTTQGWKGWFTRDQSARYDATLEVEIKIYSAQRLMSEAEVNVKVNRSRTVPEDASRADKEKIYAGITNDLANALNTELEKNIKIYFAQYIK